MAFDPKLIPLFDGTDAGQSVVEWVEKAELVCRLSAGHHFGVNDVLEVTVVHKDVVN